MDASDKNTAYEISRAFPVTQAVLFAAFIDGTTLKDIWGLSSITVDAKPRGQARAALSIDNENWDFTITYQEVVPPDKLRWIVHFDRFPSKETRATLLFRAAAGGSEVTVRMENFGSSQERDSNRQAWEGALKRLEVIVSR
ncbi:MAG: SRPBCC domain-containing protein [Acidobacteriia bacterium]|nr:SRPBCC domain-containing protein [Terriglobia bacterium]